MLMLLNQMSTKRKAEVLTHYGVVLFDGNSIRYYGMLMTVDKKRVDTMYVVVMNRMWDTVNDITRQT